MTQADVASDGDLLFGEPWLWKETASTLNPKPSTLMKPQNKTRVSQYGRLGRGRAFYEG